MTQAIPPPPGEYLIAVLRRDGVPVLQSSFLITENSPTSDPLEKQWERAQTYMFDLVHNEAASFGHDRTHFAQPMPYLDIFNETRNKILPFRSWQDYDWQEDWIDHPLDLTGEYVWILKTPENDIEHLPWLAFTRKPESDIEDHSANAFTISKADRRKDMKRFLNDLHSADARADYGLRETQVAICAMASSIRELLVLQKGMLREDDPRARPFIDQAATAIRKLDAIDARLDDLAEDNFVHAATAALATSLVDGHGVGKLQIQPETYMKLAREWASRLAAETEKNRKLDNAIANLKNDQDRSSFDRIVPLNPDQIDPSTIYSVIIRQPPQFGSSTQ